jgi:uncharacterized membrane protein
MMEKTKQNLAADETTAEQTSMYNMDTLVGYILLIGVLLSVGLIIAGTLWNWVVAHSLTSLFTISGVNYFGFLTSNLHQLFIGAIRPQLLISLGIVTLMFTPYLRVAASVVYFAFVARNLKYSIFTLFVFTVLTYSLFLR